MPTSPRTTVFQVPARFLSSWFGSSAAVLLSVAAGVVEYRLFVTDGAPRLGAALVSVLASSSLLFALAFIAFVLSRHAETPLSAPSRPVGPAILFLAGWLSLVLATFLALHILSPDPDQAWPGPSTQPRISAFHATRSTPPDLDHPSSEEHRAT